MRRTKVLVSYNVLLRGYFWFAECQTFSIGLWRVFVSFQEFHRLHDENTQLKGICEEQEQALEELGCKLSEYVWFKHQCHSGAFKSCYLFTRTLFFLFRSKLKIEDIKEANKALQVWNVVWDKQESTWNMFIDMWLINQSTIRNQCFFVLTKLNQPCVI